MKKYISLVGLLALLLLMCGPSLSAQMTGTVRGTAKGADGKPAIKLGERVLKDHGDAYASNCPLK